MTSTKSTGNEVTLHHADCMKIMEEMEESSVDFVLTDPPYGVTEFKWDAVLDYDLMWKGLDRVCKPNAPIVLFASQPFTSALGASNLPMLRYSYVWKKNIPTGQMSAKLRPLVDIEDVLVFYKKQPVYNPQGLKPFNKMVKNSRTKMASAKGEKFYKEAWTEKHYHQEYTNYPGRILEFPLENRSKLLHPTQKPVSILRHLILTYTNKDDTVLDFTMGSGSTGMLHCIREGNLWE